MRIGNVNNISFTGSIIDVHMHTGTWKKNQSPYTYKLNDLDEFVKSPLEVTVNGAKQQDTIERVLVSDLDVLGSEGVSKEYEMNKALIEAVKGDNKYAVMLSCHPDKAATVPNAVNINKLLKEYPDSVYGLKLHPQQANIAAYDEAYVPYLKLAEKHKLPCLFHSEVKVVDGKVIENGSSPEAIYKAAKLIPDTPVVMAHMGSGDNVSHMNAIDILLKSIDQKDAKLYVDISWVNWDNGLSSTKKPAIERLIKELQSRNAIDRILFGTDAPLGCYGESPVGGHTPKQAYEKTVGDLKTFIKEKFPQQSESLIESIFHKNSEELFFKKAWAQEAQKAANGLTAAKMVGLGVGAILVFSGIGYLMDKVFPPKDNKFNK